MSSSEKQAYDAQIIGVWDHSDITIAPSDPSLLLVQQGVTTPLTLGMLKAASALSETRPVELDFQRSYFDRLCTELTPDQRRIILEGRNRMVFLLNSPGGNMFTLEYVREAF